ncbi:cytochrome c biogenesis protein CcdA [Curtobacterium sp. MCLR17_031]|uniref:cytochrome c biogenesis CcdA family protein n=1 Tax=Curtobacterium sp. MCLR17_031 TaxID=2175622 RepID=UPI000DA74E86|nr:cytochrome c biogenesis protein CcdA [Curtobacterium sp. MCLR17_031]WIE57996.1 cytochrome c biogenesis protein CcdA [Curtobacterium sp. MCLR17_031]
MSGNPFAEAILSGQLLVAVPVALLAGLVSFLSPCVLPLVPGYLGFIGGVAEQRRRSTLILGVLLFILGFTVIFVAYAAAFGALGFWLIRWRDLLTQILGGFVIIMGLVFIGRFGVLQRTLKPRWKPATGIAGAPLLGIVFGLGWTPCLGPTLTAINLLSLQAASTWNGVLLGIAYCLGLGIPFLFLALGASWATTAVTRIKRHMRTVNLIGGGVLILIGVLMVTGLWSSLMYTIGAQIGQYVTLL